MKAQSPVTFITHFYAKKIVIIKKNKMFLEFTKEKVKIMDNKGDYNFSTP